MSSNSQINNENQEIDLSQISKKIGGFFESISIKIFRGILFLKRNSIIIVVLFVAGAVLGYYMDRTSKSYDSEIIVTPNFGSTDYMYSKIELVNSKIKEDDSLFLKNVVGLKEVENVRLIEIKPITDVYKFINNSEKNFEFLKLLAEDGDIKKIVNENITSKNYPFHVINIATSDIVSNEKTIKPLLDYLNNTNYYKQIQKEYINNLKFKLKSNDSIVKQIDGVLNSFSNKVNGASNNEKLIYYNENTQLNDVIKTKDQFIIEQGANRIELVNVDKIVKDTSITTNVKNTKGTNNKMKLILPIFFIFLFILIGFIKSFYKKQLANSKL